MSNPPDVRNSQRDTHPSSFVTSLFGLGLLLAMMLTFMTACVTSSVRDSSYYADSYEITKQENKLQRIRDIFEKSELPDDTLFTDELTDYVPVEMTNEQIYFIEKALKKGKKGKWVCYLETPVLSEDSLFPYIIDLRKINSSMEDNDGYLYVYTEGELVAEGENYVRTIRVFHNNNNNKKSLVIESSKLCKARTKEDQCSGVKPISRYFTKSKRGVIGHYLECFKNTKANF